MQQFQTETLPEASAVGKIRGCRWPRKLWICTSGLAKIILRRTAARSMLARSRCSLISYGKHAG